MSDSFCVVYSDLGGWSKLSLAEQVASAIELFKHVTTRIDNKGLSAIWKASTGDGFAIAFPRKEGVRVIELCHDLLDQYANLDRPQLRLGVAEGSLISFSSPLTDTEEYTGPAVIKARRILDGITNGTTLLVQKNLATDLRKSLPKSLIPYIVPRADVADKHGETHEVVQILSSVRARQKGLRKAPPSMQELFEAAKSDDVRSTEAALGDKLFATDGLIIRWMYADKRGMEAAAIQVKSSTEIGSIVPPSSDLPSHFIEHASRYLEEAKTTYGNWNRRKLWLKDLRSHLVDRPTLELGVGETDYLTTKALEFAFDKGSLRADFEQKTTGFDILNDLPGFVGAHVFIMTSDDKLILGQRAPREVDHAGGSYSPSFEEHWNPDEDRTPYETVLRGLSEEFNLDKAHEVYLSVDNVRLFAIAREWGALWNTVLIFGVKLPATAAKAMSCWSAAHPPEDKPEHIGLCAVPIGSAAAKKLLRKLVTGTGAVSSTKLKDLPGSDFAGTLSDAPLHPTSGKVRIILALHSM